jgi:glycosyltransferase involved in cell wall biosynthesis
VAENEKAALWLLKKVFNDIKIPFVIAGKEPSKKLLRTALSNVQACVIANPSEEEMQDLISKAQINILPSFNCTGIKLKLLNALFNGRHCVVNEATTYSTGLEPACHTGHSPSAFKSIIMQLYRQPFGEEEISLRKRLLLDSFNNRNNAQRLIQWIW